MLVNMDFLLAKVFYQRKTYYYKIVLQKNSIKNLTSLLIPIKGTNCAKSNQIYSKDFTFCKYLSTKELTAKYFFDPKQNDLSEFKNSLELFCHDTGKIKLIKEKSQKKIFFKKNCGFCSF